MLNYENFLLEKRIDQLSARVEITLGFDVIKTNHAEDRQNFSDRNLGTPNQTFISNLELKEFVRFFIKEISTGIISGDIKDNTEFVIRSFDKELAMAIVAKEQSNAYWKLIIKTVFRESIQEPFRVGREQIVFDK